ncbi:MAG: hypothetical protein KDC92_05945 [Bacteroidetes bacterium]|nr:hypothetical protein [Bacteroidota bacterium]
MKLILLSLTCLFTTTVLAVDIDTLEWSENRKLAWDDFKAKRPADLEYEGYIHVLYTLEQLTYSDEAPKFQVLAYMDRNESWKHELVREGKLGLMYTQTIFDMAELSCRRMRKRLDSMRLSGSFKDDMKQQIFDQESARGSREQMRFEQQSLNGTDTQQVYAWAYKINEQLEELSNYKKYHAAPGKWGFSNDYLIVGLGFNNYKFKDDLGMLSYDISTNVGLIYNKWIFSLKLKSHMTRIKDPLVQTIEWPTIQRRGVGFNYIELGVGRMIQFSNRFWINPFGSGGFSYFGHMSNDTDLKYLYGYSLAYGLTFDYALVGHKPEDDGNFYFGIRVRTDMQYVNYPRYDVIGTIPGFSAGFAFWGVGKKFERYKP